MSQYIPARDDGELIYADRYDDKIHTVPILAWDVSSDPPAPITPIGVFYPGQRYAITYGMFCIVMPDRIVTHRRAEAEARLLGRVTA